jgi:amino acid adenylation domain-containing protein
MLLDQLVSHAAERFAHQTALVSREERLSYRELDLLSGQVATALLRTGLRPGSRVGLYMEKSARAVAILLGTLRAGGVYVPIDPESPPRRAAVIVRESAVGVLALSSSKWEAWQTLEDAPSVPWILLDEEAAADPRRPTRLLSWDTVTRSPSGPDASTRPGMGPDEAAYILYTSGSTGVPKGVVLSHGNALAFVHWAAHAVGLSERDKVLGLAPFHFDLSVFDLYASFQRGATLVLAPEWALLAPDGLIDLMRREEISVLYSVPSIYLLLMRTGRFNAAHLPNLGAVIFAGEVFPIRALRDLKVSFPGAKLFNFYGPTETNVCLYYPVESVPSGDEAEIPIGWPCCQARVSLRDDAGREVEGGEAGELFVDGPTVMLGYWKDGRVQPAARPYATGDRVTQRADGAFFYRGRRDHQAKVQGVRVELGDVEAALCRHPGVREAVALTVDQRLVALIALAAPDLSVLAVKRHCADQLPRSMVPRDIFLVDSFPRCSNGKVDRQGIERELRGGSFA